MLFYPDNALVPDSFRTDTFVLVPLTPTFVKLDYDALMTSKEMLRLWSGSPWPTDDFTLAENLADLRWHWHEHQNRLAFTFSVLNPAEDACLGCVYIKPMVEVLANNPKWQVAASARSMSVSPYSALVRFWTVETPLIQNLDKTLLRTLRHWFAEAWAFSEIYWHTPVNNAQQLTLFQTDGLHKLGPILLPDRGGEHILFQ